MSVALKVQHRTGPDSRSFERFAREILVSCRLSHPNIVRVFDGGEIDGTPFLAMELLDGGTLSWRLNQPDRLSIEEAVRISIDLAAGLACLHELGLLHRDIKPANIMLTTRGGAKLVDFGLCRSENHHSLTESGEAVGTPLYLAPEILEGAPASRGSDMWSLGCVVYRMLTGVMPFPRTTPGAWVLSLLQDEILPPHHHRNEVPAALSALLLEVVERDPTRRLESAAAFESRLQTLSKEPNSRGIQTKRLISVHELKPEVIENPITDSPGKGASPGESPAGTPASGPANAGARSACSPRTLLEGRCCGGFRHRGRSRDLQRVGAPPRCAILTAGVPPGHCSARRGWPLQSMAPGGPAFLPAPERTSHRAIGRRGTESGHSDTGRQRTRRVDLLVPPGPVGE
jgi:serine/threonine protein kinase